MNEGPPGGGALQADASFRPVRVAVLTISDTRTEATDASGALLRERIASSGHALAAHAITQDAIAAIQARVRDWVADDAIDAVITTGGTGITGRDVTPEAIRPLFEKEIEGFQTVWHMLSFASVGVSTMQSRACAGVANGTFIFCLPGSTSACRDGWDKIIRWQFDIRHRPCNMVELMPRLLES